MLSTCVTPSRFSCRKGGCREYVRASVGESERCFSAEHLWREQSEIAALKGKIEGWLVRQAGSHLRNKSGVGERPQDLHHGKIFSIPHCLQVKHANRTGVAGGRRSAVHRRKCPQAPHDRAAARAPRAPSAIRPANPRSRCAASTPRRAFRGEGTTRSSTRSYQLRPTAPGWSVGDAASCQDTAVDRRVTGRPCGGGS